VTRSLAAAALLVLLGSCQGHPAITPEQISTDLNGRAVGEGFSMWMFVKEEDHRTVSVVEDKRSGDRATLVVEIHTQTRPFPIPSFPPMPTLAPLPAMQGMAPSSTMATVPPPTLPPFTPHKWSGRVRLHYEWVAGEWSLLRLENLSFKRE
jgi:hypothetical protein